DNQGLRLTGGLGATSAEHDADAVAAAASGVTREAARTTRLLELGEWRHILIECDNGRLALVPVAPHGGVLVRRPRAAAPGRVLALAGRAARTAAEWIGHNL
ncbi:MAG TPA: roadblock/LC7 domain-containing protein, partial [Gemmatimonadales bacterium]|nr:roadblock/LC7 domain-containing protein [Gemmatimonadales bacterium]